MNLRNVTELDLLRALSAPCASLGKDGTVPDRQVTGQVTDVLEFASAAGFPAAGTKGKYYVDKSASKAYEWNGTGYVETVVPGFVLGQKDFPMPVDPQKSYTPGQYADAFRTRTALSAKASVDSSNYFQKANTFGGDSHFQGKETHNGSAVYTGTTLPAVRRQNHAGGPGFLVYPDPEHPSACYSLVPCITVYDNDTGELIVDESEDCTSRYVRTLLQKGMSGELPLNLDIEFCLVAYDVGYQTVGGEIPIRGSDGVIYRMDVASCRIWSSPETNGYWSGSEIVFSQGIGSDSIIFNFNIYGDAGYEGECGAWCEIYGYGYGGPPLSDSTGYTVYPHPYGTTKFSAVEWYGFDAVPSEWYTPTRAEFFATESDVDSKVDDAVNRVGASVDGRLANYVPKTYIATTGRAGIVQLSTDYKSGNDDKAATTYATRSMYQSISCIMGLMNYPRLFYGTLNWGTGINGFFMHISTVPLHGVFRLDVNSGSTATSLKFPLMAGPSAPAEDGTAWGSSICNWIQRAGRFPSSSHNFDNQSRWAVFYLNIAADAPHSDYTMSFGTGTYDAAWREYTVVSDYDGANPMTFSHAQGQQAKYIVRLLEVDTDVFYLNRSELH